MSQYYNYDDIQTDQAADSIHECIEQLKRSEICNQKILTALLGEAHGLSEERKELNPWLPIENAPKDESEILLFVPGCYGCEIGRWDINSDSWSCHPYAPTHYQELPDDPV